MKVKAKVLAFAALVLALFAPEGAWASTHTSYAKLVLNVSTASSGRGTVYAAAPSGGTSGQTSSTSTATYNETVDDGDTEPTKTFTANANVGSGWTFLGWSDSNTGTINNQSASRSVSIQLNETESSATRTYYAHFGKIYSATLNIKAGTGGTAFATTSSGASSGSDSETVGSNGVAVETAPNMTIYGKATANSGYVFKGWSTSDGGSIVYTDATHTFVMENGQTATYYAVFEPQYYATVTVTARPSSGDWGLVYASNDDSDSQPSGMAASKSTTWTTSTSNASHKFWLFAASKSGYMHWGWKLDSGGEQYNHDYQTSYGGKAYFTREAATTPGGTKAYNFEAIFKRLNTVNQTLVIGGESGANAITVPGTLQTWRTAVDTTKVTAVQNGSNVDITAVATTPDSRTTVEVLNGDDFNVYQIEVKRRYFAKLTVHSTGNGKVGVNNSTTAPSSFVDSSKAKSFWVEHTSATPVTISAYGFAQPDSGYGLGGWSETADGAITSSGNPQLWTIASSATSPGPEYHRYAHFGQAITVTHITPASGGTATITSSTPAASGNTITQFLPGTINATFTATPSSSAYALRRWAIVTNGVTTYTGENPLTRTFTSTATVQAEFMQYVDGGAQTVTAGTAWTNSTPLAAGAVARSADASVATAAIVNNKLVVTAGGKFGASGDNVASTTVTVDTGTQLTTYTIKLRKLTYTKTYSDLAVDEIRWETGFPAYPDPEQHASIFTTTTEGIADAYQDGSVVKIKGVNRGTTVTSVDGYYFNAVYNITVTKPYVDVFLAKTLGTYFLPVSASDPTDMIFTNILDTASAVTSTNSSMCAATRLGDKVQVTINKEGQSLVTVDCHLATYLYVIDVHLTHPARIDREVATAESFVEVFEEVNAIENNSSFFNVTSVGGVVTVTGVTPGLESFYVYGRRPGSATYVCQEYSVQVYDGSQGSGHVGEGTVVYMGAETMRHIEVGPGVTNLILCYTGPGTTNAPTGTFKIEEGFVAKVDILAIAGGGAGGTQAKAGNGAGGGGAGGVVLVTNLLLKADTYSVIVGAGGKKADAKATAASGNNGENTYVMSSSKIGYASALGGGGGAASMLGNVDGVYGGSGGGAAWYEGTCGQGGYGLSPQGMYGAASSTINNGGGGGGASADAVQGTGGAGYETTFAKFLDPLTGAIVTNVYSTGGNGGRGDVIKDGADGLRAGDGGEGGSGSFGGSGADGIVFVRITSLVKYTKVPIPTNGDGYFKERFVWTNGNTYTAFDIAGYNNRYKNTKGVVPIQYVDGVVSTNCWMQDGSVIKGNGYYTFVVYLNEGFSWDDGTTYGVTGGKQFSWRIVMPETTQDPTVAVNKWVEWDENDNNKATIHVTSHASPEMSGGSCKVLFMGGLCNAHSQQKSTLVNALNAIAKKGDVDYHLCYDTNISDHVSYKAHHGSLKKGETFDPDIIKYWTENNHFVADQFLEILSRVLEPTNKVHYAGPYDYIVFEFDGNRMGRSDNMTADKRRAIGTWLKPVAKLLEPFYDNNKVIWIVDDVSKNPGDKFKSGYYTPSSWTDVGNNHKKAPFAAMCALLDPDSILYPGKTVKGKTYRSYSFSDTINVTLGYLQRTPDQDPTAYDVYVAVARNAVQTNYANSGAVEALLDSAIKVTPYNLKGSDMIKTNVGLDVDRIEVYFAPETGAERWQDVPANKWENILEWTEATGSHQVNPPSVSGVNTSLAFHSTSNYVEYAINNLLVEAWSKLDIHVVDDGTFKSSVGAVQNPNTGAWEKNPNYGSAKVAFIDEGGNETEVKGSAETAIPLSFNAYTLSGSVTNGEIFMNGMTNNPVSFAEGTSPAISYRGDAGYWLKTLVVDGHEQQIDATNLTYVLFRNISANHNVVATYVSIVGGVSAEKTTFPFDGKMHLPNIVFGDDWGVDVTNTNLVKIVYSTSPNADDWYSAEEVANYPNPPSAYTCVGEKTVYYRVMVNQPGWGATGDEWGWKVAASGSGKVEITKTTLYVKAKDQKIKTGDPVPQTAGADGVTVTGFVGGDDYKSIFGESSFTFSSADYNPATSTKGLYKLTPGGNQSPNYELVYLNGVLSVDEAPIYVNGVVQASFLSQLENGVAPVEKTYDGVSTNLIATITSPTEADRTSLMWSRDGQSWQAGVPTYTDAGTYKVWYKVEGKGSYKDSYAASTNFQYVTIHPREVTLLSGSDSKHFDGTALSNNTVTVISGQFVTGQGVDVECLARITEAGSLSNLFVYTFWQNTNPNNYVIAQEYGLLVVLPAQIILNGVPQPDDVDPAKRLSPATNELGQAENGVQPIVKTYDGKGTNLVIDVQRPQTGWRILYTTTPDDPTSWTEDFEVTDVFDGSIWYAVEDSSGNYAPVTNLQFVTVLPRPAEVWAGSATRVYDGTALTCTAIDHTVNMVEGESISWMTPTPDSYIIHKGTTANKILDVVPAQNTDARNYDFTYFDGTLTVTKRPVTITSPTKSGTWQPGMTFTYYTSEITGDNFVGSEVFTYSNLAGLTEPGSCKATFDYADGTALLDDYDITVVYGDLILGGAVIYINGVEQNEGMDYDSSTTGVQRVNVVYDGQTHLPAVTVSYPTEEIVQSTTYSLDGDNFYPADQITLKNVTNNQKVYFRVEADGFTTVNGWSYVTITKRSVTITAATRTWPYDGTEHRSNDFTPEGFVTGEGITSLNMWSWCKRTEVGSTNNCIGTDAGYINYQANTDPNNYSFTYVRGLLTVTPAETHPIVPEINRVYDGTPTNFVVTVPSGEIANPTVKYSTDGGATWTENPPAYTDVTNTPVMYLVEDPTGNHQAVTNSATVVITHRAITVTVNPAQMKMGEPEPAYSAIVTCDDNGEALDPTEAAKLVYNIGPTGIKVVGANTLHASGEQLQGNYKITYVDNILTIYDKETLVYTLDGETVTYDGYGHGLTAQIGPGMPKTDVKYALSEDGPWYDTLKPAIDVSEDGGVPIWYALMPSDPTYQAVTNVAVVKVVPKAITITANDAEKFIFESDPVLTATASGLAVPDQGKTGLFDYTVSREAGEAMGTYTITVSGAALQGNYTIIYAPGTFTVVGFASLWICDHADAGNGQVYLAFCPTLNKGGLTAANVLSLAGGSHIRVACAATEAGLAAATPTVVPLRDPTAQLDLEKGWIWVTVDMSSKLSDTLLLWKIVIDNP